MASKAENRVVYLAGMVQGIVLVTFPAASTIFTSRKYYGLSSSLYGDIFVPQVLMAILASLLTAGANLLSTRSARPSSRVPDVNDVHPGMCVTSPQARV